MMETRVFGQLGWAVPVVGLGTWATLDVPPAEEASAYRCVRTAFDAGSRFFDTSPMYGRAEGVLARALSGYREEVIVATKIWARTVKEGQQQFRRQLELFDGRVDLLQIHNAVAWEAHLGWLEKEVGGRVGALGATGGAGQLEDLRRMTKSGSIQALQIPYNVLETEVADSLLPLAHENGLGVVAMRPFAEGALLRTQPEPRELAPFHAATLAEALLRWVLSDHRVHVAIPATRRIDHASANGRVGAGPWMDERDRIRVRKIIHVDGIHAQSWEALEPPR